MWKLNSTLLNNQWVEEEITRETTKYLETKEKKYKIPKLTGWSTSSDEREIYTCKGLHLKKNKDLISTIEHLP